MPLPEELEQRARALVAQMVQVQPMRRGSVGERYVKCSKPGCACGQKPEARHGPYYSLTRKVGASTQSRFLSAGQAAVAQRQIEAGRAFRVKMEALWQICEQWCDVALQAMESDAPEAVEKGGSKRASPTRSGRRSRH